VPPGRRATGGAADRFARIASQLVRCCDAPPRPNARYLPQRGRCHRLREAPGCVRKLVAEMPQDEPEIRVLPERSVRPGNWRPIWVEVARQTGIPAEHIKKGDESRGQPFVAYRQLAMVLTIRLGRMSMPAVARIFGCRNHTTALHAREQMRAIIDAVGLDESASVSEWVAACLPLVLVHLPSTAQRTGLTEPPCTASTANSPHGSRTANSRGRGKIAAKGSLC
jgi:hypothetical protein